MKAFKYRSLSDLKAFRGALEQIAQHSQKMAAMTEAVNRTILSDPLAEATPGLGLAAIKVGLEELEAMGAMFEQHAVRFLGEARRRDEGVLDYVARINSLDIQATQKRHGIMLLAW